MTTQQTTQQTTEQATDQKTHPEIESEIEPVIEPGTEQPTPVPTQRSRRGWSSFLDAGDPLVPAAGEPEAWARLAHAERPLVRRWAGVDDGRPAVAAAPHLATRPFFARYPLLGAGRS